MSDSLIQETKPVIFEGVFVLFIGLIIIYNITVTDISFHGDYVGKLIEICHPKNISQECMQFRQHLGVPSDAQMQLGDPYWQELARQAFVIGITMFLLRFGISCLLHKAKVQKIRPSSILMAILYGTIGYGLFLFGVLDTLYFVIQHQAIPTNLGWLDHAGVFEYTKGWDGNKSSVSSTDLYMTNLAGVMIIGTVFALTMIVFKESGLKRAIA